MSVRQRIAVLAASIERHRLTQAELAARAGVHQTTVGRLLGGQHAPFADTLDRVERALAELIQERRQRHAA